jgi:RNA polymerase sigma-70 factor (ECF subfamily)
MSNRASVNERGENQAEALLSHVGWMRELAQALLGDPAAADDVVQDSLIVAWRRAPRDGGALEPWLSRVLRNLAWKRRRSALRRVEHEGRAEGPRPQTDPHETAERLDLQRRVLEAVQSLEEPLRTTLVLRYFEGRNSAEIAQLQGVPAGTVRWRLARALEELRERLDERHDGSRAAWSALLAPLARPLEPALAGASLGAGAFTGALLMSLTSKWILAFLVASLAGAAWWIAQDIEPGAAPLGVAAGAPVDTPRGQLDAPADSGASSAPSPRRADVAVASTPHAEAEPAPAPTPPAAETVVTRIQARFVDAHGTPWPDVRASLFSRHSANEAVAIVLSAADGRAEFVWKLKPGRYRAPFRMFAQRTGCAGVALVGVVEPGASITLGDIVLGPAARIVGRVVDERGFALEGAKVGLAPEELRELDREFLARHGDEEEFFCAPTETSGAGGAFELSAQPGRWRVWAHSEKHRYGWSEPVEVVLGADVLGLTLVVPRLRATDTITGRVRTPDGEPAPNAVLYVHYDGESRTGNYFDVADAEGRFELLLTAEGAYSLRAQDAERRFEDAVALDVAPGTRELELRLALREEIELDVRDPAGNALADVSVELNSTGPEPRLHLASSLRSVGSKHTLHRPRVGFTLDVSARGYLAQQVRFDAPETAPAKLEFTLLPKPTLRGRAVANGAPLAGLQVWRMKEIEESTHERDGFPTRWLATPPYVVTAEDGSFALELEGDERWYVRVDGGERFAAAIVGPFQGSRLSADPLEVELDQGGAIEGVVLDGAGSPVEGAIVGAHCGDASPRTLRTDAAGRYRFERLTPGSWHVLLRAQELRSDTSTTSMGLKAKPIPWNCEVPSGGVARVDLTQPASR